MLDAQTLGEVLRALNSRGFSARRSRGARRVFEGPLKLSRGTVPVRLVVEDWEFLDYPRIQLLDRPSFLPELLPHATADGDFCYLRPESLVLDRFNPVGAILLCIAEATLPRVE
ncbi:E2/UBC family protein [Sinimarinibacterium flocculans]|uniref:E2/UBC family protein n=1 Tax=Sinimarinibacterium flocculans TaxID=985250 RepID=UPI00248FC682|nr:E2/UBC family protein [Sinimarinibacterium flocculans]